MFSNLFKKPKSEDQSMETLRESEDALQLRMNRMLRQNLKVVFAPPPVHAPVTATRAIAEAIRRSA